MSLLSWIAAATLLALTGWLLALSFGAINRDGTEPAGPIQRPGITTASTNTQSPPTATPFPRATAGPARSLRISSTLEQSRMCDSANPAPDLTEFEVYSQSYRLIARIYCSGADLKYIDAITGNGEVDRTYLLEDGQVRVKLYYSEGQVIKRDEFDAAGRLVPDGSLTPLSNHQIANHR